MRAVRQYRYGTSETWNIEEIPTPSPGPGEVLVRVEAAALDRGTWHLMTGTPYLARTAIGWRRPKTATPGRDLAGVVESCGEGVGDYRPGDRVIGTASGSLADYATVPTSRLSLAPTNWTAADAAALPVSGITALQAVSDKATPERGDRVAILGASGGVGSYAVQLAADAGADITAVCSAAKATFVSSLGAQQVLDYASSAFEALPPHSFDQIIDIAGNRPLRTLQRLLAPQGRLVIVGGEGGGPILGGLERQLGALIRSAFSRQTLTGLIAAEQSETMARLVELADAGRLRPVVTRTVSLDQAAEAMTALASGQIMGKVVVTLDSTEA